jgi:hypothetical protein
MQTYVFDVTPFRGREVRIRIVDDGRSECGQILDHTCLAMEPEHINADLFLFADSAPIKTAWMRFDGDRCGGIGFGQGCSPIGRVPSAPPLWGITDAHSHPMANIAFGGHVIWGDVTDPLDNVYSCNQNLLEIPGPGGRPAIGNPDQSHTCYLAGDVNLIAVISAGIAAHLGCAALFTVPFVGVGAAAICHEAISAAEVAAVAAATSTPDDSRT